MNFSKYLKPNKIMAKRQKNLHLCTYSMKEYTKDEMLKVLTNSSPDYYVWVGKEHESKIKAPWQVIGPVMKPRKKKQTK